MSGDAAFYVLPWSIVVAQQQRAPEPQCCHESPTSFESLYADPTQLVLGHVHWRGDWAGRERFEAQPGVICLGEPWERVPPAAIPLLEQFRMVFLATRAERIGPLPKNGARPDLDTSVPIDVTHTVRAALRKAHPMIAHELG